MLPGAELPGLRGLLGPLPGLCHGLRALRQLPRLLPGRAPHSAAALRRHLREAAQDLRCPLVSLLTNGWHRFGWVSFTSKDGCFIYFIWMVCLNMDGTGLGGVHFMYQGTPSICPKVGTYAQDGQLLAAPLGLLLLRPGLGPGGPLPGPGAGGLVAVPGERHRKRLAAGLRGEPSAQNRFGYLTWIFRL